MDYRATASTSKKTFSIPVDKEYLPIYVNLDSAPSTDITVGMTITYYDVDGEMVLYSTAPVTINPDPIVYNTWELSKSIRVKVNNTLWSANTASYFEVHFTFTGSDAAAYKE